MPSTYTLNNGIELIGTGEQSSTWGDTANTNLSLIDTALDGQVTVTLASAGTSGSPNALPISDGAASNGRNRLVIFADGADLGADAYVQLTPDDAEKIVYVRNSLSGSRNLILFQGTYNAANDFVLAAGKDAIVKFDGGGTGAVVSAVLEDLALDAATITTISNTTLNTGTANATTVDTTSIEVTNLRAKDGSNAGSIANSTGVVTLASSVLTTTDINGGTIDGTTIGGTTPAAVTGTTGTFSGDLTVDTTTLHVDSANNRVGINTTTPSTKLTVSAASGDGIFVDDSTTTNASPFVKVRGKRGDANVSQSFTGKLLLDGHRTDAAVASGKTLGAVAFGGNHTDGSDANILYSASISGVAEGTFSNSTTMPTALAFYTGSTGRTDATPNVTFGFEAIRIDSSGNVGIGTSSPSELLDVNGDALINGVAVGRGGGNNNSNTALGRLALDSNVSGTSNTAVGNSALQSNTGTANTAVGNGAMLNNTASNNVALGAAAMNANTTGTQNTALGRQALFSNTTSNNNTAVGFQSLYSNTAEKNTAVGHSALQNNTTGTSNVAVGLQAGGAITTGTRNVIVGALSDISAVTGVDQVVVGYNLTGKGDDTAFIGGTAGAYNEKNVTTWETTSDERIKKNITDNNDGLSVLSQIQVRNFEYRTPEEITDLPSHAAIKQEGVQLGVIAQELQQVLPECVSENSTGVLSVNTDPLVWYLINAVKELKAEIETLKGN